MTRPARPSVSYVLPDKLGGLLTVVANLLAFRAPDGFDHHAVLVHNPHSVDTRFGGRLAADRQVTVEHRMPRENLHAVLRRLAGALPQGPGVLVANDWIELAMLCRHDPGKTVVQIVHGDYDYYYDLAVRHEAVIDVYVASSRTMYETLCRLLPPHRESSVLHLPYGVQVPEKGRAAGDPRAPLRLIYAGRLASQQKGLCDLPEIERRLRLAGIAAEWTIVGDGPDRSEIFRRFRELGGPTSVRWLGALPNTEVIDLFTRHDVFVLPTRAEGFSAALLEAMGAGLVPVVSDLPSGTPEVVKRGETGFLPAVGDVAGFVAALAALDRDRPTLERMSRASRELIAGRFDVRHRVRDFQELFARCHELRRPRRRRLPLPYGSRLDRPWLPNGLVRSARHLLHGSAGLQDAGGLEPAGEERNETRTSNFAKIGRFRRSESADGSGAEAARLSQPPTGELLEHAAPSVVYVLPDKLGGLLNIVANLLAYRQPDGFSHQAVLVHNPLSADTRFGARLAADRQVTVEHEMPRENLHAALRRLARALPPGPGVLVANDWLELALLCRHDPGKTVVQILHGDHAYYYDLAVRHAPVIDVFVAYGQTMYDTLCRLLPERRSSILHLPYGIPLPPRTRPPGDPRAPLRLIYAGRLEHGQKGVFDLPEIAGRLAALGVAAEWTIVGDGPDRDELKRRFTALASAGTRPPVRWLGALSNPEVVDLFSRHDVFVLPTRAEGFPVALVEAMAAGTVPVVSDIPSGVPEIVTPGVTGHLPAVGDVEGFAAALADLDRDRPGLERMSAACRLATHDRFDVARCTAAYQELFARHRELRRPRPRTVPLTFGSRLDQAWLPNPLVRGARFVIRQMRAADGGTRSSSSS